MTLQTVSDVNAALEALLNMLESKRDQLAAYRDHCDTDNEIGRHARTIAVGRYDQVTMDIRAIRFAFNMGEQR